MSLACASQRPPLQRGWYGWSVLELGISLLPGWLCFDKTPKSWTLVKYFSRANFVYSNRFFFLFYNNYFSTPPLWKPKEISPQHLLWECGRAFGGKTHKRLGTLKFVSFLLAHTELPANPQIEFRFSYPSPGSCKGYCLWWIIWNSKNLPGDHSISETNIYLSVPQMILLGNIQWTFKSITSIINILKT